MLMNLKDRSHYFTIHQLQTPQTLAIKSLQQLKLRRFKGEMNRRDLFHQYWN